MKIGLFGINFGVAGNVDAMISIAKAAEASGIESVWTGEHVVLPDPRVAPSPSDPQTPLLDPAVALSHIAAHTEPPWDGCNYLGGHAYASCVLDASCVGGGDNSQWCGSINSHESPRLIIVVVERAPKCFPHVSQKSCACDK
jgi:hypothetical protein